VIRQLRLLLACLGLLACASVSGLRAQTAQATLNGQVFDTQHAAVADADVTITNTATATQRKMQTSLDGSFSFGSLPPATYMLHVERKGFAPVDTENVTLHTADNVSLSVTLKVGSASETVTVTATLLTNDSPSVSLTVPREFVDNMPLNGRSLQDLIQLAPGAVSASGTGFYTIDGQRMDSNYYTVDGVSVNLGGLNNDADIRGFGPGLSGSTPAQTSSGTTQSMVSVDDLQEFTIQTSGYTADYGRYPGGQVQFATRSGTNEYHGTLFEYFRNEALDAKSWFENFYQEPKPAERQNDFGGTLGGPVKIPKLYNGKDKTFFFFSYEGLRLEQPTQESKSTPTAALRAAASPAVRPFLDSLPLPNGPLSLVGCNLGTMATPIACSGKFNLAFSQPNSIDSISARLDHEFGDRNRAFLRYSDTPSNRLEGKQEEEGFNQTSHVRTWTAGLTSNISSSLLNDLRFNYSYDGEGNITVQKSVNGSIPFDPSLLIPSQYAGLGASGEFVFSVHGSTVAGEPNVGGANTKVQTFQIVDGMTWIKGNHALKFGVDWRRVSSEYANQTYDSLIESTTLLAIEDGIATSASISSQTAGKPVFLNLSLYAGDHWKLTPRLSVDYGLRWEFNPPPGPVDGNYPVALTSTDIDTTSLKGLGSSPYPASYRHFAPRVGFAWNAIPSTTHPVTVRGGFGIFYDTGQQIAAEGYGDFSYPFENFGTELTNVPLPLTAAQAAPPPPITSLFPVPDFSIFNVSSPNLTMPYTEQWNLSVDYALSAKNTFSASYIGNNGKKLLFTQETFPLNNPNLGAEPELNITSNAAESTYHALQLQDRGRITNGLDVVTSFTWAHAEDNSSTDYDLFSQPQWGNSDYDIRRSLDVALNYQIPVHGESKWMRALTGGWLIANRLSVESALPINIIQDQDFSGETEINYYPDLAPGVPIYLHGAAAKAAYTNPSINCPNSISTPPCFGQGAPGNWALNPAAFTPVALDPVTGLPERQGNLGRNFVRQTPFWALNTSVQRTFAFRENLHLDFRMDAFNILNHPNPTDPDTDMEDGPTFGFLQGFVTTIGTGNALYAMGSARSLQLSLKLRF
jgi:hypothetical protein